LDFRTGTCTYSKAASLGCRFSTGGDAADHRRRTIANGTCALDVVEQLLRRVTDFDQQGDIVAILAMDFDLDRWRSGR
jgi:hypothetical protein